jgi:hypothetical protein
MTRKRLAACRQNVDQGDVPLHSHCYNLYAQASICAYHPNDARHRRHGRAGSHHHYLSTQSELWWLDRCGLLARRYTHTVHLRRDAEQGGT